jgi:hypothetical protein
MAGVAQGDPANVHVDRSGYLHLRIVNRNGKWTAPEMFTADNLGFGTYQWVVQGNVYKMDKSTGKQPEHIASRAALVEIAAQVLASAALAVGILLASVSSCPFWCQLRLNVGTLTPTCRQIGVRTM